MFGLFKKTYDYYEWNDLVCVSDDKEKLIAHHETIRLDPDFGEDYPILSGLEQQIASNQETIHYTIDEIVVL